MEPRIDYYKASPDTTKAMHGLERAVCSSGLEPGLLELVKMRASQINGCAYCLDMHSKDARAAGETEQRLYTLNAWRETPFFSDRERAALEWTESLTMIAQNHVPDDLYQSVRKHFQRSGTGQSDLRRRGD
jgi:AhpD family alkylhydroperoxidase